MINVEVAYAKADNQRIVNLQVEDGCNALQAAEQSGIAQIFPEIDLTAVDMGVFGKVVKPAQYILRDGDRVEIYRPLIADPKEVRKARAAKIKAEAARS